VHDPNTNPHLNLNLNPNLNPPVVQVIDWDGFAELEMVTLACVALRSVTISHCDSLLDATCTTFADGANGGGVPGGHSSNWRCPDLRRAAHYKISIGA